jgi:hypothetical protein
MVRALLDDSKTQTRRICKPQMTEDDFSEYRLIPNHTIAESYGYEYGWKYGQVGDELWVRETFCDATDGLHGRVLYRATGDTACKWKPSIFMPRAASRITLEITNVRVERLHDIRAANALAEGIIQAGDGGYHLADTTHYSDHPIVSYASLWESINGAGSWGLNPWVWVIEFKKVKP